jgi:hypothetical protein
MLSSHIEIKLNLSELFKKIILKKEIVKGNKINNNNNNNNNNESMKKNEENSNNIDEFEKMYETIDENNCDEVISQIDESSVCK